MGSPVAGNQHIVQIFNQDETQLLATLLAVPDYRSNPTDKAMVEFGEEATSGSAQPVMEWFYPGDSYGHEFVYPIARAVQIARATNRNVLATRETSVSPGVLVRAIVIAVTPLGKDAKVSTAAQPES
jgi:hypothetical protein